MEPFFTSMLAGASAGLVGLLLISRDLAQRCGLGGGRRMLLMAGLGMGVIAVSIKLILVAVLMQALRDYHPAPRPAKLAALAEIPGGAIESVLTAPWQALPAMPPDGNPWHTERIRLGQRLFNDASLSIDGDVSCSSCHKIEDGGDDNAAVSTGIRGLRGTRNAPTVWNASFLSRLFWDGRAESLEEQAKGPLLNPVEMGMPSDAAVEAAVRAKPDYVEAFARIYGADAPVTIDNIAHAIAAYERTLVDPDTNYDRFVRGETNALTQQQIRGMALFAGLGCRLCHRDPTFSAAGKIKPAGVLKPFPIFSDNNYVHRYGLLEDRGAADPGHPSKTGLWRVPSLRNVAHTAPYFHNGSAASLEEAIRVMAVAQLRWRVVTTHGSDHPAITWDARNRKLSFYRPEALTPDDILALAAFLESLSNPNRPH